MPLPLVGVPGGKQRGGELLDLGDVVARPRFAGRRVDLQRGHVLVEQVLLWSASSSYARPREPAALVSTSSTSVTLRQAATSTPAIRSTDVATSDQMKVAACPRWVTSYGVIPHTYKRAGVTSGSSRSDRRGSALRRTGFSRVAWSVPPRMPVGAGEPWVMRRSCVDNLPGNTPGGRVGPARHDEETAMRVDQNATGDVIKRLRRAEGQIRGVIAMLESGRDCADVVTQLAAVSRALDRAGFKIIASGLQQCITAAEDGEDQTVNLERMEKLFLYLA